MLGVLEAEKPDGTIAAVIGWEARALAIRLRLRLPQAAYNLRRLNALRGQLGAERFTSLLAEVTGDSELAEAIISVLD